MAETETMSWEEGREWGVHGVVMRWRWGGKVGIGIGIGGGGVCRFWICVWVVGWRAMELRVPVLVDDRNGTLWIFGSVEGDKRWMMRVYVGVVLVKIP